MNYDISSQARNASWQCLIDCGISELPIKPVKIAAHYGIECHASDSETLNGLSGALRPCNGKWCIFVDSSQSAQRQRYTIMHELGHYLLRHLDSEAPLSRCSWSATRSIKEQTADKFAADTLMPACVLWGLNIRTAEEIAKLCNVSMQAAQIRAERMEVLYQRNKFLTHPLERQVYKHFQHFIESEVKKQHGIG